MDHVLDFLKKEVDFTEKEKVIAAVSGGPDSMVLLDCLLKIRKETNIDIICAHVNHGIREESAEEKIFVEKYCKKNNIIFEYMKIEKYSGDNFHNQARIKRYDFYEKIINKYQVRYLFTGHHGDDLIETILMRMVRGSTLGGYSGFSKKINKNNYTIIRPLIFLTKKEIMEHAKENNLEYRIDKSNFKETYTRNRFRKKILPFLKKENPNVHQKFLKFSETLEMYNDFIDSIISKKIYEVYKNKILYLDKFKNYDKLIKIRIINYILEDLYDDDLIIITDVHTNQILDLVENTKPNLSLYLPGNKQIIKSYEKIKFYEVLMQEDYEFELKDKNNLINGKNIDKIESSDNDDNNICRLKLENIELPLKIRNRREGDKIEIKGMLGTKKIKDIFINKKIAYEERNTWPILVDKNGKVLWVPGLKKSKFNVNKNKKCDIILKYH